MNSTDHMHDLLAALELALRENDWWGEIPPNNAALTSSEPFCIDTLHYNEWLRWVYIPKMRAYIAENAALPPRSGLLPIAEETWKDSDKDTEGLLLIMRALDALVNGDADHAQHIERVNHRYRRH